MNNSTSLSERPAKLSYGILRRSVLAALVFFGGLMAMLSLLSLSTFEEIFNDFEVTPPLLVQFLFRYQYLFIALCLPIVLAGASCAFLLKHRPLSIIVPILFMLTLLLAALIVGLAVFLPLVHMIESISGTSA